MSLRRFIALLLGFSVLATLVGVIIISRQDSSPPKPNAVIDAPYMDYCRSSANPHWKEQVKFLREHRLYPPLRQDLIWIDIFPHLEKTGELGDLMIRYYAGSDDADRCTFGFVISGNHPEDSRSVDFYTCGVSPADEVFYRSPVPPKLRMNSFGQMSGVLRCDFRSL